MDSLPLRYSCENYKAKEMKVTLWIMQKHVLSLYVRRNSTAALKAVVCIYQAANDTCTMHMGKALCNVLISIFLLNLILIFKAIIES